MSDCVLYSSDFVDNASGMRVVQTPNTSTSWNSREKQSEIDNDHLDPLFHSTTEDFQPQPFVDSDEEESSGMSVGNVKCPSTFFIMISVRQNAFSFGEKP